MGTVDINSEILIDTFIDDSWLEKGLSKNTLSAYRHDIISFSNWYKGSSLLDVSRGDLLDYLATRLKEGYSGCLLYTSPSPRDRTRSRMPSSA